MLSKPDINLIELFEIPVVCLDDSLTIIALNEEFSAIYGDVTGKKINEISDDFNERKFARKTAAGQAYSCILLPPSEQRTQFSVELKPYRDHFMGLVTNTSSSAKAEAMLASYSELIEKQNREIKAKTEQINRWRTRIENELEQAATVQDLLVPKQIRTPFLDSRCEPLRELSGDFHEFARHDDGQITFISGDVAGKGIYAAIMLAQTLTAFRAWYNAPSLTEVAVNIVDMLDDRFPDGLFVALTLVRQSADQQTISVLNLGNPDALLIANADIDPQQAVVQIPSIGPAIGVLPSIIYAGLEASEHQLTGKKLYVFSDGILDINLGPDHQEFADGLEVAAYLTALDEKLQEKSLDQLIETVRANKQVDDVTIAWFSPEPRE